tara:strand:+ start:143 stop:760 length:618 start_codon:yes stop_codon:yes gene_type:complete
MVKIKLEVRENGSIKNKGNFNMNINSDKKECFRKVIDLYSQGYKIRGTSNNQRINRIMARFTPNAIRRYTQNDFTRQINYLSYVLTRTRGNDIVYTFVPTSDISRNNDPIPETNSNLNDPIPETNSNLNDPNPETNSNLSFNNNNNNSIWSGNQLSATVGPLWTDVNGGNKKQYVNLQSGGKRLVRYGPKGGKYYMKGGNKHYIK